MNTLSSCRVHNGNDLGLKLFGKNWKKIETIVRSRTGSQIRSHAQKFFNKLERKFEGGSSGQHLGDSEGHR